MTPWNEKTVTDQKVDLLNKMNCWDIAERPQKEKFLHTDLVLKMKRDEEGITQYCKACLIACGNDDGANEAKSSPPCQTSP